MQGHCLGLIPKGKTRIPQAPAQIQILPKSKKLPGEDLSLQAQVLQSLPPKNHARPTGSQNRLALEKGPRRWLAIAPVAHHENPKRKPLSTGIQGLAIQAKEARGNASHFRPFLKNLQTNAKKISLGEAIRVEKTHHLHLRRASGQARVGCPCVA
jgi:hypothetical protein